MYIYYFAARRHNENVHALQSTKTFVCYLLVVL